MFEELTRHIEGLKAEDHSRRADRPEGAGGLNEHSCTTPSIIHVNEIYLLEDDLLAFVEAHPEYELTRYAEILESYGLKWGMEEMSSADVSDKGAKLVLALLIGAFRAERFCDGALYEFRSNRSIERWLRRLEEIDREKAASHALFLRQKALLDQFLSTGAISKTQYDVSLNNLARKMNEE